MNLLRALGIGVATYLGMVMAVVIFPTLFFVALWIGVCALAAIFLFVFWLLVTHDPHTLYSSLYMLAYGALPCIAASVLSFYYGQLRARRKAAAFDPCLPVHDAAPSPKSGHGIGRVRSSLGVVAVRRRVRAKKATPTIQTVRRSSQ
jgi:hypothetical protein